MLIIYKYICGGKENYWNLGIVSLFTDFTDFSVKRRILFFCIYQYSFLSFTHSLSYTLEKVWSEFFTRRHFACYAFGLFWVHFFFYFFLITIYHLFFLSFFLRTFFSLSSFSFRFFNLLKLIQITLNRFISRILIQKTTNYLSFF